MKWKHGEKMEARSGFAYQMTTWLSCYIKLTLRLAGCLTGWLDRPECSLLRKAHFRNFTVSFAPGFLWIVTNTLNIKLSSFNYFLTATRCTKWTYTECCLQKMIIVNREKRNLRTHFAEICILCRSAVALSGRIRLTLYSPYS